MNRQHHISLREEFDEHDGSESKYIVLLDDTYPIATCRFYALDKQSVLLGRVVVLPEYRGKHLGIIIDSRTVAVGFYEKLGYTVADGTVIQSWKFDCIRMHKQISAKKAE